MKPKRKKKRKPSRLKHVVHPLIVKAGLDHDQIFSRYGPTDELPEGLERFCRQRRLVNCHACGEPWWTVMKQQPVCFPCWNSVHSEGRRWWWTGKPVLRRLVRWLDTYFPDRPEHEVEEILWT